MSRYLLPVVDPTVMPGVALDAMNEVHKEEVVLINRLGELVVQGIEGAPDLDLIGRSVDGWVVHTRDHFYGENRLMERYGFPPYPVHKAEHAQVLARLESIQAQWIRDQSLEALADFIFNEWRAWFDQHVKSMDTATALFLRQVM
ncbi:MAG: hemerythrin family protein [Candidatus Thiodiazotropha sp. (ex Ctena orbiculata)]|nr:hemerythrin family protein [Candidatus Thiodiazotropha taylori]